jgi:hypothetical protein
VLHLPWLSVKNRDELDRSCLWEMIEFGNGVLLSGV